MDSKTSSNKSRDLKEEIERIMSKYGFVYEVHNDIRDAFNSTRSGDTIGKLVLLDRKDLLTQDETDLLVSQIQELKKRICLEKKLKKLTTANKHLYCKNCGKEMAWERDIKDIWCSEKCKKLMEEKHV